MRITLRSDSGRHVQYIRLSAHWRVVNLFRRLELFAERMVERANMPSNGQASLATSEAGRHVSWTAAFSLLFLLLAILSTFVHSQNECGQGEFLNRTAMDAAAAENNNTAANASTICSRCDTVPDHSYCTACYFNISDSQVICEKCQSGLEIRDGVCRPSEGVEVPPSVIIVAVVVTVGGSVCIVVVACVVHRCRSGGCRRTPAPRPRRKLPSPDELDDVPQPEVTASTEGRTGPLKKLSSMIRGERYTAGPEGDSRRMQGVHAVGSIGNSRPTIASVHYEPSAVQTQSQETPMTSVNSGKQPQQHRSGAPAHTSRPTPPVPGSVVTASPRGTAIPNGNDRVRRAEPLRPERPVSLVPDPGPFDDQEIYMNTSARQSPAHSHTHEFPNPSFVEADPGQNDDDGEIYANDTEIGRPAMTFPPPGDVIDPVEDVVDVALPDAAADGREYVNVAELRQQMEQRKQQQQQRGGGGRVTQDQHQLLPESEPEEQEVYENVAPEKPPSHRRPARR